MSTITSRMSLRTSQAGMVSIMTTMILMIVISLIVLGFAQISRRNQRETLDRQLSTQAFYAAESGVNDVRELIKDALASGSVTIPDKSGCTDTGGGFYTSLNPVLDTSTNVRYTCVLVDPSPEELRYGNIGTTSTIVPLISASGANFSQISLNWESALVGGTPMTGCPGTADAVFSPTASWSCGYGVLRFDLVPVSGSLTADSLRDATMTVFGVPVPVSAPSGTNSVSYAFPSTANNNRRAIRCTNSGCNLMITGLTANAYFMRISSIYRGAANMEIRGTNAAGAGLEISGSQAVIDATGKAQDVLRRIQVHVPLRENSENLLSDYAIQSTDAICKRFSIMDGYFDTDVAGVTSTNRLCQP